MKVKNDAAAGAMGFLQSNLAHIEQTVYKTEYTKPMYTEAFAPGALDTSAGPWARSVEVYSIDMVGMGKFLSGNARDVPIVDIGYKRQVQTIEAAGIGYRYTLEELMSAMEAAQNGSVVPGQSMSAERAMVCREVFEQHLDRVAMTGDTDVGFEGFVNNSNVPTANVVAGVGGVTWEQKTADEILFDVNDVIADVYDVSKNVELPGKLLIPSSSFSLIATRRLGSVNDTTVLEFIKLKNAYTARTGRPLEIVPMLHLETVGAGSTKRMVVVNSVPYKQKMHLPMPLQFQAPQQTGFEFVVPGMYRLGPAEWRYPLSGAYRDGI